MFGIIVLVCIIIYAIYSSIVNDIDDNYGKKHFYDPTTNTYINHNGVSKDLKTNKYRFIYRDSHNDRHIWGKEIGDINLSQFDRQKEYEHYQKNPVEDRTTVYWAPSPFYKEGKTILLGKRYKDLETGNILIVRTHKALDFYIDIETLQVLRYTDSTTRMLKESNRYKREREQDDIKEFQLLIDKQRRDKSYVGDPTYGKALYCSKCEDYWKPEKIYY